MTVVEPQDVAAALSPESAPADHAAEPEVDPVRVAEEIGNTGELKRKSKVAAFVALPGVPEGTVGKVALVGGWDPWIRYHVLFDNGVALGSINREALVPAKKYDEFVALRREAFESGAFDEPEVDESAEESGGGESGGGGGGDAPVVNGVTIPAYLIERSKAARERLGA